MTQAYQDWLKLPESERNAEAATVVMGWFDLDCGYWYRDSYDNSGAVSTGYLIETQDQFVAFSPCTDRNATDIVLAEVERRGLGAQFDAILGEEVEYVFRESEGGHTRLIGCSPIVVARAPASLLTWVAREALALLKEDHHGNV